MMGGQKREEVRRVLVDHRGSADSNDIGLQKRRTRRSRETHDEGRIGEPSEPDPTADFLLRQFDCWGSGRFICGCTHLRISATHVSVSPSLSSSPLPTCHHSYSPPCSFHFVSCWSKGLQRRLSRSSACSLDSLASFSGPCPGLLMLPSQASWRFCRSRCCRSPSSSKIDMPRCLRRFFSAPPRTQAISSTIVYPSPLSFQSYLSPQKSRGGYLNLQSAVSNPSFSFAFLRSVPRGTGPLRQRLPSKHRRTISIQCSPPSLSLFLFTSLIRIRLVLLSTPLPSLSLRGYFRSSSATGPDMGRSSSRVVPLDFMEVSQCFRALCHTTSFSRDGRIGERFSGSAPASHAPSSFAASFQVYSVLCKRPSDRPAERWRDFATFSGKTRLNFVFLLSRRTGSSLSRSSKEHPRTGKNCMEIGGYYVIVHAPQGSQQALRFRGKLTEPGKSTPCHVSERRRKTIQPGNTLSSSQRYSGVGVAFVSWRKGAGILASLHSGASSLVTSTVQSKRHQRCNWRSTFRILTATSTDTLLFLLELPRCLRVSSSAGRKKTGPLGSCQQLAIDKNVFFCWGFGNGSPLESIGVRFLLRSLLCTEGGIGVTRVYLGWPARNVLPYCGGHEASKSEEAVSLECWGAELYARHDSGMSLPLQEIAALSTKGQDSAQLARCSISRYTCETEEEALVGIGGTRTRWKDVTWTDVQEESEGRTRPESDSGMRGEMFPVGEMRSSPSTQFYSCLSVMSCSPSLSSATPGSATRCKLPGEACIYCRVSSISRLNSSAILPRWRELACRAASGIPSSPSSLGPSCALQVPLFPPVLPSAVCRMPPLCSSNPSPRTHAAHSHRSSPGSPSLSFLVSPATPSSPYLFTLAPNRCPTRTACRALPAPPPYVFFSVPVHGQPPPTNGSPPVAARESGERLAPEEFQLERASPGGHRFYGGDDDGDDSTKPGYSFEPHTNGTPYFSYPSGEQMAVSSLHGQDSRGGLYWEPSPRPSRFPRWSTNPDDASYRSFGMRAFDSPRDVPNVTVTPPTCSLSGGVADTFYHHESTGGPLPVLEGDEDEDDALFIPRPRPSFLADRGPEIARGQEVAHREAVSNMFRLDDAPVLVVKPKQQVEKRSKTSRIRSLFRNVMTRSRGGGDRMAQTRSATLDMGGTSWVEADALGQTPMSEISSGQRLGLSSESTSYEASGIGVTDEQSDALCRPGSLSWSVELPLEADGRPSPRLPPDERLNPSGQSGRLTPTVGAAARRSSNKEGEHQAEGDARPSPCPDKRAGKLSKEARSSEKNTEVKRGSTIEVADSFWCCCPCVDAPDSEGRERISTGRRKERRSSSTKRPRRSTSRRKVSTDEKNYPLKDQKNRMRSN
ncbi:hypothetical protein CSUI_002607 [Cystoisospora suis]|uniref:Uncharacterized protein n=1 Tax=Cystoisospora suis TaxID=483139 RepID=A0A2C6L8K9_9APIC|nr:hypothetical protein CSUI_002607 [Cystoisospora suis]